MSAVQNPGVKAYKASEAMDVGVRVKLTAGYQDRVSLAGAADPWIGINLNPISSAQATDLYHTSVQLRERSVKMRSGGAITAGARVFGAASGRVDDAAATGRGVGVALQAAGGSGELVEILPDPGVGPFQGLIWETHAASTAVTASATETTFSNGTATIDGAQLLAGDIVHIRAYGLVGTAAGTETVTVKVYLATEAVATTGAVDPTSGDMFALDVFVKVRTAGASGKLSAYGMVSLGTAATATAKPFQSAELSEDISGTITITVTVTNSSTGESVTLENFDIEILRK